MTVTIVQYNVGVFDKYEGSSIENVADIVKMMAADIVTLNEVDSCTVRTEQVDQIAEFARAMGGWSYHYAPAMQFNGGAYGIGVVSRPDLRMVRTENVALPRGNGYEPRVMAVVEFQDFIVATVHLDLTPESRLEQVQVINDHIDSRYKHCKKPIFLTGDFNARPDSELIGLIQKTWNQISALQLSYPSHEPDRCIDYIFVRPQGRTVKVLKAENISPSHELSAASDHLPVKVSVRIK